MRRFASWEEARAHGGAAELEAVLLTDRATDSLDGLVALVSEVRVDAPKAAVVVLLQHLEPSARARLAEAGAHEVVGLSEGFSVMLARRLESAVARVQLEAQHRQLERLISANPDAVLVVDGKGVVQFVNEAALQLFGRTREELLGELLGFSVVEGSASELELLSKGTRRTAEIRVVSLEWHGRPALLASIRDVTDRKQAEELRVRSLELAQRHREVLEANRLKGEFLATISHERRAPLNAIIGFAEVLHDGHVDPDGPEHHEFLGDILASGRHLLQIVNDVLDLAKVEAGKLELRPAQVRLSNLFSEVVGILKPLAMTQRVRVSVEVDPEVEQVFLDPLRVKQILYNYLSNALKFTAPGGAVVVRGLREGTDRVRLEVEDTGSGIAPKDLPRLFSEFRQFEVAGSNLTGTGLGLALTKRLAAALGGTVGVQSVVGKGSTFHVVLPRQLAIRDSHQASFITRGVLANAQAVLVIDDGAEHQDRLFRILQAAGYAVEFAESGAEALERWSVRSFAAITTERILSDMDVRELMSRMRLVRPRLPPTFIVSAYAHPSMPVEDGVVAVLAKPVNGAELLEAFERAGLPEPGPLSTQAS